ncbi:hypothetical protein R4Z10_02265 [Niallia sp. XMNu-256]|uniref:hypothetical protein n=1 Tax=Niallia sp. XMNu-256 TaxID=3082444 RepID=UPI0030D5F568
METTHSPKTHAEEKQNKNVEEQTNATQNRQTQLHETAWHELDSSFLPDYVHEDFIKAAKPFLPIDDIYNLWSKVHLACQKLNLSIPLDDVIESIITDFKQTIFKYKKGKIHTTFEGYFYRVVYSRLWHVKKTEHIQHWYNNLLS